MRTLWNAADRAALLARLDTLTPASPRRWGRMSVAEMTAHLLESMKITFDEKPVAVLPGRRPPGFVRWLVIFSPLPWPRGVLRTSPEYLADNPDLRHFAAYRADLRACLERFAVPQDSLHFGRHALFGNLTTAEWGALTWRHLNHHLTQFGC